MLRRAYLVSLAAGSSSALGCGLFSTQTAINTSRSLRLENGFFLGHDLRQEDSVVYVLDLSGSMSGRTGSTMEQAGKEAAAEVGGSLLSGVTGSGVGNEAAQSALSMDKKVELVKDHLIASLRGCLPAQSSTSSCSRTRSSTSRPPCSRPTQPPPRSSAPSYRG